ncbi:hypothetical protein TpMuguga_02g00706 [Theileria parva strain Muguga]|uniref:Uncharacterized protein n=1 Tax=Theileria parva TaxID=5875 RepID=Q4N4D4_THEPA|nr:uncharacterized protein TpMuguga_02g00706 [Theileria parva strain Muguga]EAN32989.1 hypothetical protein TpMuguga_02g00706 [Theileria parva strain Muguga]|eukprot:XP_765272.1 hypothetical protein [Theileria parva strain Muguga]
MPLLVEFDLKGGTREYLTYNFETNNWLNDTVTTVRAKLNVLKENLGVPLVLDLGNRPSSNDMTYTTNDVLVRVTAADNSNTGFPKYTHRFTTGKSHFVGSFLNAGAPQMGLPVVRLNELSVYFSDDVPLLLEMNLTLSGGSGNKFVYYTTNGFGFWTKALLGPELKTPAALLKKLVADNKKLVADNDKYVVDVSSKNNYLSVGKLLTVTKADSTNFQGYEVFVHKAKNNAPFKFEKLSVAGKDVKSEGVDLQEGASAATVYCAPGAPKPQNAPSTDAGQQPQGSQQPPQQAVQQPVQSLQQKVAFANYYAYNGETGLWKKTALDSNAGSDTNAALNKMLETSKASLGSVTLDVGHSVGTYKSGPVTVVVTSEPLDTRRQTLYDKMVHELSTPFTLGKLKSFDFGLRLARIKQGTTEESEDFTLKDVVLKKAEVYVYKYVPLGIRLFLNDGTMHYFLNSVNRPSWLLFTPEANKSLLSYLDTVRARLNTVSSLDVCRKLTSGSATTYELPRDAGTEKVQVTLSTMEVSKPGLTGLTHKFTDDVKLSALNCNGKLLTGLDYTAVRNVHVYYRGAVPAVVKTNSDPRYFRSDGTGLLSLHPLPQGANDLTAEQVGNLLNEVSEDLGPVLELNLQAKSTYIAGGTSVNVTSKQLNSEWNVYTHSVPETAQKFTVSKFLKGTEDVNGLPTSSTYSSVLVGLKGDVPHVLALKTVSNPRYVWYVFNKYKWLFDYDSDELPDDSELLGYMLDVEDGLDNEYDFELAPGLHSDSFALDYHDLYLGLESYTYLSYLPFSKKFPFLVKSLMYDSVPLELPGLNSQHLKWLSVYTLWKAPVVFNAFTHDNKHLFYENTSEGVWKKFELAELSEKTLYAKLKEVKDRASSSFSPELTMKESYKKYGFSVDVSVSDVDGVSGFKKYVHKLPRSADETRDKPFTVPSLSYNYVPLNVVMPKGTMTQLEVFQNSDGVPLGVYFLATLTTVTPATEGSESSSTTKQSHNYFFNTSGQWVAHDKTDAALQVEVLKTKLTAANETLDFYVEVDLVHKLPYVFSKDVKVKPATGSVGEGATEKKAVDFLVTFNPRPFYKYTTYTHVPQVRVGTDPVKTQDFAPFVTAFKEKGTVLKGFDLLKVVKFTVYWLDDSYPVFVHVTTSNSSKYFGRKDSGLWVPLKTATNALDDVALFELLSMARKNFAYSADVELTGGLAAGYWERYFTNGLAMKVVDQGLVGQTFKSYLHSSASVFSPTFKLMNFNLWGRFVYKVPDLGYTHFVRVVTDLQDFPLLMEVGSSLYNTRNGPLRYYYFQYFPDPNFGWLVHTLLESKTKLNEEGLLNLLKFMVNHSPNVHTLVLDKKANYNSKTDQNVTVSKDNTSLPESKFEVWTHTLSDQSSFKTLLLEVNGKRVVLVNKVLKFKLAKVYWLSGVPVHVELEHADQKGTAKNVEDRLHYFWTNGDVWNKLLDPLVTNETPVAGLHDVLLPYYTTHVTLDLGKRLKSHMTGRPTQLQMVEYKHENFDLPEEMVGYLLFSDETGVKLDKVMNHGFDFARWNLPLPKNNVYRAVVYSPDYFYSPVFLELLSKSPAPEPGENNAMVEHYHYYYPTSAGNWVFLNTDEKKLDLGHLRLKLESFTNPLPVLLDLAKKNGTYGLNELAVTKTMLHSTNPYAKYVHKLTNNESFLTGKWVFGGLVLSKLPLVRAKSVSVYFYQDLVPLLVEVVDDGLVRHFSVDAKGFWLPDFVLPTAVLSYLDYLVNDLMLFGKSTDEWVPQLYNKFLSEFELVPELPAPKSTVPAQAGASGQPASNAAQTGSAQLPSGTTGVQVATSAVTTTLVRAGTASEQRTGVLRTVTSQERQQTSNVESTGQVAQVTAALSGSVVQSMAGTKAGAGGADSTQSTAAGTPRAEAAAAVPTVKATTGADGVSGSSNSVLPLSTAAPARKPRRSFRPVALDFDKLFFAYVSLGKFVVVKRFEYVPYGYNFSRHSLLGVKSLFDKFFLNDRMYSVSYYSTLPVNKRKVSSLGFYSWADNPLLLKLGFDNKTPKFFSFDKTADSWNAHNVVNLDEELEDLNNKLNDAFVFELSKPLKVEYRYYNNTAYRTSLTSTSENSAFFSVTYKTYRYRPSTSNLVDDVYTRLKFKVAKLRLNGVDLSVDGLPVDMSFYMLKVHSSKSLGKPLVLVLSDYKPVAGTDGVLVTTVTESTQMNTHYHYHLNAEGSWTFFVPEGDNGVNNKLVELEKAFAVRKTLDLAVVTGAATSVWYKTKHEDFTVDRVFLQLLRPHSPPVSESGESSAPQFKVVDPLLGLPVKTELPGSGLFLNVPLAPYKVPVGPELGEGFELYLHHKPYFLHSAASAPQQRVMSAVGQADAPVHPTPEVAAAVGALSASLGQDVSVSSPAEAVPPAAEAPPSNAEPRSAAAPQAQAPTPTPTGVVKFQKFLLNDLWLSGFPLDFAAPFEPLADGYAGLTVFYQKNSNNPFMFALFAPLENSGSLDKAFYHVWVNRDLKWVKTTELQEFYKLMRSVELRLDLSEFSEVLPKFTQMLTKFSNESKTLLTNPFRLDLNQDDRVTFGDVVVDRDADVLPDLNLVKVTFTPSLTMGDSNAANFTLEKVTNFKNNYAGFRFPLFGVVRVNVYFRNEPDRYAKVPVLMEFVQKASESGANKLNHSFYAYQGGNEWKFYFMSLNKLEDHEVSDLVNYQLYQFYRVSKLRENALLLDLDTKFSHMNWGRFVDSVEFYHDPTPNAPLSPVPEGFLLYRHSMATENTTFTLPFFKLQGHVKETGFKLPFAQYFVYYKVGEHVPFVFALAQCDNVDRQPTHHWYFVKQGDYVKFKFAEDVDPDNKDSKTKVAEKFKELLNSPPAPLNEPDTLNSLPTGTSLTFPTFPLTDPRVLSKPSNGVPTQSAPKSYNLSGELDVGDDSNSWF